MSDETKKTLELKFDVGDTVWYLNSNQVYTGVVTRVEITRMKRDNPPGIRNAVRYHVDSVARPGSYDRPESLELHEVRCFESKTALLESL